MKIKTTTGSINISLPQKLEEVTLGQLIAMQSAPNLDDLQAISILGGVLVRDLQNISNPADLEHFSAQVLAIAQQIKYLYNSEAIPETVNFIIDGKAVKVKVNKNLSVEPAGAFWAAREVIAAEIERHVKEHGEEGWQENFNPSLAASAKVLAQCFYCRATGKPYNEIEAAAFGEQVKQLPVTDALPIAKYFFLSYPNLSKPKTGFWRRLLQKWSGAPASAASRPSGISIP